MLLWPGFTDPLAKPGHSPVKLTFSIMRKTHVSESELAQATSSTRISKTTSSTSLDPEETTQQPNLSFSYRARLLLNCQAEYDVTHQSYLELDNLDSRHRSLDLAGCRMNAYFAVEKSTRRVVILSDSCRLRWCPICSRARSANISEAVVPWLRSIKNPKLLTLTLAHNNDSIASQITRLYASFVALRRLAWWRRNVAGGIWFFQITHSEKTGCWHPHIHTLLSSDFLPHKLLSASWHKITGDSDIVDIRRIYQIKKAADYVARYSARPAMLKDLPPACRIPLIQSLHGRRLCGKFGTATVCDLSGQRKFDTDDVYEVISWDMARDNITKSPPLQILWNYYNSGEPLPDDFDYQALRRKHSQSFEGIGSLPARPPPDPHFAFP